MAVLWMVGLIVDTCKGERRAYVYRYTCPSAFVHVCPRLLQVRAHVVVLNIRVPSKELLTRAEAT